MTKNEWSLLMDIVGEHYSNLEREKDDVPYEELPEYEECMDDVYNLMNHLLVHIKYIKEITYNYFGISYDAACGYLAAMRAPGIERPGINKEFPERIKAS